MCPVCSIKNSLFHINKISKTSMYFLLQTYNLLSSNIHWPLGEMCENLFGVLTILCLTSQYVGERQCYQWGRVGAIGDNTLLIGSTVSWEECLTDAARHKMIAFENLFFCIFAGSWIDIGSVVPLTEATTQGTVVRSLKCVFSCSWIWPVGHEIVQKCQRTL